MMDKVVNVFDPSYFSPFIKLLKFYTSLLYSTVL